MLPTQERHNLLAVFTHAPVAIALLREPNHRLDYWNDLFEEFFPGGRVGATVAEALPALATPDVLAQLDRLYEQGGTYTGPVVRLPGAAAPRYVTLTYQAYWEQGRITGVALFVQDVTSQQLAQRQIERVGQVFAHTPAAICIQRGPEHCYEYVNAAYQRFFPGRDLIGLPVAEAVPEVVATGLLALLDRVYQTGETYYGYDIPVPLRQPDGSVQQAYVTFTYQAYRENGQIAGISTFAYDVGAQVLARQQQQAQQELISTVFAQAPAGIWVVSGPDYVFEILNPVMEQILGCSAGQAIGRPYFAVLPELVNQGLPELLRRVWEQGETVFVEELPAQLAYHQAAEMGYFTFVFQPLRDAAGHVARISCVALDISAQVQSRHEVQQLNRTLTSTIEELFTTNKELKRVNADLDTFIYTASHDLRSPISNIEGLVDALRQELMELRPKEPAVEHILGLMDDSIQRFQQTIGHLTQLMTLQHSATSVPVEHVDVAAFVQGIQLDLAPALEAAQARVEVAVTSYPALVISPKLLRSIVANFLSNAVKYRAPERPPIIELRISREDAWLVVQVQDNGLGLTAEQQRKLFGLFQRLHAHVEGSGVGLYSVKKLVDNAGGTITVASAEHVGSTFTVRLPLREQAGVWYVGTGPKGPAPR